MTELFLPPLGRLTSAARPSHVDRWSPVGLVRADQLLSVGYVAWEATRNNPELQDMKWGWILVTLYLGPVALFLYVLTCKEPFPGHP